MSNIADTPASKLKLYQLPDDLTEGGLLENFSGFYHIPLKTRRAVAAPGHQRWKPENFYAEIAVGWSKTGLHCAFKVRDREVHNTASLERLWSEDCLEILLDVRSVQTAGYTGNSMHIFCAPVLGDNHRRCYIRDNRQAGEGFTYQSMLTNNGWAGSIFIPWQTFPGFAPAVGVEIGLGFQVSDDYGRPDNNPFFNAQYMRFGSDIMPRDARTLPRWVLSEKFVPSPENDLSSVMAADLPKLLFTRQVNANIVIAGAFKDTVSAIKWQCTLGEKVLEGVVKGDKLLFDLPENIYGNGKVELTVYDKTDRIAGILVLPFQRYNGEKLELLQKQVIDLIKQANLPELAKNAPGKIAGYFGLLNNLEQLKRMIFLERTGDLEMLAQEIALRLELLQGKTVQSSDPLFGLLNISSNPEAQVSVEYPRCHPDNQRHDDALIKFYCAAIPLAQAVVKTVAQSTPNLRQWLPALYYREMMPTEDKTGSLFYFKAGSSCHDLYLTTVESLPSLRNIDAVIIAGNAPAEHAFAVQEYARQHALPTVEADDLENGMQVLYAGRPDPASAIGKLFAGAYRLNRVTGKGCDLILDLPGNLQATIRCISRSGCELIADILAEKRSFTVDDNRRLTGYVAEELARRGIKPFEIPENYELMAADVHCHTIYSDGLLTPLGLVAAALYGQMDFLLIADHETADGAFDLQKAFKKYNFAFPLIAGEENSLPDGHFNSYPVKQNIPCNLSFAELLAAAHAQGATVQYNHPATYSNRRDLQLDGIAGTTLEGWEHQLPAYADKWAELPAQIGSSDNHNTAFPTERTIVCVKYMDDGKALQEAVHRKYTGMLEAVSEDFIYAPDNIKGMLSTALQEPGKYLLEPYYRRVQKYFAHADIAGLFKDLPGATPAELGK